MSSSKEQFKQIVNALNNKRISNSSIKKLILKHIKEKDFNINQKFLKGKNIGHYTVQACESIPRRKKLIKFLSQNGLIFSICDDYYDTLLHLAVRYNNIPLVKEIIKTKKIDINIGCELDMTVLHISVSEGYIDMVKLLLKLGCDPSLCDEKNNTPYDYAVDEKNQELIKLLDKYQRR